MNDNQPSPDAPDADDEMQPAGEAGKRNQQTDPASRTEIAEALDALDETERELILDAHQGATYREIAARRGMSEATVKSTIRRGLSRLAATILRRGQ